MRTMHLFAGAGGGLLADLILGHKPVVAVEWEPHACEVLSQHAVEGWFPDLHVFEGDVRMFDPSGYAGRVDCINAGFPCQDISSAGKRAGVGKGTRSGFYREVLRIADVVRPRFLFLENVAAIASAGAGGQPLAVVAGDLAARGFDAVWTSLAASDVGAPHQRNRWWCLAWRADADGVRGLEPKRGEQEKRKRSEYLGWWQVVPDISRVADGIPDQLDRDKETGNGQVPLQAAAAFVFLWQMMEAVRG